MSCNAMTTFLFQFNRVWIILSLIAVGGAVCRAESETRRFDAPGLRSELFGLDWEPTPDACFESEKVLQDFSQAGYRLGDVPLPDNPSVPIFDVVEAFGADPSGFTDSSDAIRSAIAAASSNGGGIVYLPEGIYRVSMPDNDAPAFRIVADNIVVRGAGREQTYVLNTSTTNMRGRTVFQFLGSFAHRWNNEDSPATPLTHDLMTPTRLIPVADTTVFSVGDEIVIRADPTPAWVEEHNEPLWLGYEDVIGSFMYVRRIMGIDSVNHFLEVDVPTRYYLKTRDNARVYLKNQALREVGIEHLSIGNLQHPSTTGWNGSDHNIPATGAYDVHRSLLIMFARVRNGWIRNVATFQPDGNTTGSHLLSNGIELINCRAITISGSILQRPQYGGGGGNGYMYTLIDSSECLIKDSRASFSRHGFVVLGMGSSGNVLHHCRDELTGRQTGSTGEEIVDGAGSDHHRFFSHSCLVDASTVSNSFFEARYRPVSTPVHGLTAAHSVFWNIAGYGTSYTYAVHSQQSRYGYVIGTRGLVDAVRTDGYSPGKTDPVDHVEAVGEGDLLWPQSLFREQRRLRLGLPTVHFSDDPELYYPTNTVRLTPEYMFGDSQSAPEGTLFAWQQISGPAEMVLEDAGDPFPLAFFPYPGVYQLRVSVAWKGYASGDFRAQSNVIVTVYPGDTDTPDNPPGRIAYVAHHGSNNAAGTLEEPWRTIGHALSLADHGDTILVGEGVYPETVLFPAGIRNLTLAGGYETNQWSWQPGRHPTVIASTGNTVNVTLAPGSRFVPPHAEQPAINPQLRGMVLTGAGVGVHLPLSETMNPSNRMLISHCVISNQSIAAIVLDAPWGLDLRNSLIAANDTGLLHQGHAYGESSAVENCTFVSNSRAQAWFYGTGHDVGFHNTILAFADGNGTTGAEGYGLAAETSVVGRVTVSHSLLFGHTANSKGSAVEFADANLEADPEFIDVAAGNYRLAVKTGRRADAGSGWAYDARTSPAIDAGAPRPWIQPDSLDLDGGPRIREGVKGKPARVDMGAYEQTVRPLLPRPTVIVISSVASRRCRADSTAGVRSHPFRLTIRN